MSLNLYTYESNYRAHKALITAEYAGVKVNLPKFQMGKDNQTAEFKAKFPLGKVPALETPHGGVFESNAIASYIATLHKPELLGRSPFEQVQVRQWIEFANNEVEPNRNLIIYSAKGFFPANQKVVDEANAALEKSLMVVNEFLQSHTYLVGHAVTLADIILASGLVQLFVSVFTPACRDSCPHLVRWFNTLINQPEFSKVVGKVEFNTAGKGEKAAAAAPVKKEAAAPKPAASTAGLDDDDLPKPKPKSPLDLLPPSPMVLDTVKKLAFSQRPMLPDFFEKLWPQFDADGYSWWICDYKYNAENTVYFMTGNAVGGFLQRCDATRKYALGVMNIAGNEDEETGPFMVSGAWCFRGLDITPEMKNENPDSEYYEWKKVDIKTDAGKQAIKDQFLAEKLAGQSVLDRRYFK
jgi:elongation factor 1-gamma